MSSNGNRNGAAVAHRVQTVRDLVMKFEGSIKAALPKHMTPDRMLEVLMLNVRQTPGLAECTDRSLMAAVLECTKLGLEPGDSRGLAYLIPFNDNKSGTKVCQFVVGYRGLIDLAYRSGQVANLDARAVFEGDDFEFEYGLDPKLKHKPAGETDPSKLTHVYCVIAIKGGDRHFEVMTRNEIERIRRSSRAGSSASGPWTQHYTAMAKKTVVRQACKLIPSSAELQRAITLDEAVDANIPQRFENSIDITPDPVDDKPRSGLDQLAETIVTDADGEIIDHEPTREPIDEPPPPEPEDDQPTSTVAQPKRQQRRGTGKVEYPLAREVLAAITANQLTEAEMQRLKEIPTQDQVALLDSILESETSD